MSCHVIPVSHLLVLRYPVPSCTDSCPWLLMCGTHVTEHTGSAEMVIHGAMSMRHWHPFSLCLLERVWCNAAGVRGREIYTDHRPCHSLIHLLMDHPLGVKYCSAIGQLLFRVGRRRFANLISTLDSYMERDRLNECI